MGIRYLLGYNLGGVPLYVVVLSGLVGVAVDVVDHPLGYYFPEVFSGRFLHLPILAGAVSIILYCCTRGAGLYIRMVLRRKSASK